MYKDRYKINRLIFTWPYVFQTTCPKHRRATLSVIHGSVEGTRLKIDRVLLGLKKSLKDGLIHDKDVKIRFFIQIMLIFYWRDFAYLRKRPEGDGLDFANLVLISSISEEPHRNGFIPMRHLHLTVSAIRRAVLYCGGHMCKVFSKACTSALTALSFGRQWDTLRAQKHSRHTQKYWGSREKYGLLS